jgi:hypothetical protein
VDDRSAYTGIDAASRERLRPFASVNVPNVISVSRFLDDVELVEIALSSVELRVLSSAKFEFLANLARREAIRIVLQEFKDTQ